MEIRHLRSLLAVARLGSVTRAADELHLTQPALSRHVKALEQELGVALLRRAGRGVELTAAGEELAAHAETVVAAADRARAAMDAHAGATAGLVRIGVGPAEGPWVAAALVAVHAEHPGIRLALREGAPADLLAAVRRGGLDLAVAGLTTAERGTGEDVSVARLGGDPLTAIAGPHHPLAAAGSVGIRDLAAEPFAMPAATGALRDAVLAAFAPAGLSPAPRFEAGDPATIRTLVAAGLAVSLVPASWLAVSGPPVATLALDAPAGVHERHVVRPRGRAAPAARTVRAALRDAATAA